MRTRRLALIPFVLAAAGLSGCATMPGRHLAGVGPVTAVNDPAAAQWTPTTWDAVSTPQHRKMLEHASPMTVTGEVIDVSCFLQLGKRGEAHVACGQKCVRNGQPVGILSETGDLYLVIPEEHHPRRDGQVSLKERFAELMGKRVQVSGMATSYRDYHTLFVRSLPTESASSQQ